MIDVLLRGPLEEAGSLVVVLRLWRVFKIIEEFSTGANDEMEKLYDHIDELKMDNDALKAESKSMKKELATLKAANQMDGHADGRANGQI